MPKKYIFIIIIIFCLLFLPACSILPGGGGGGGFNSSSPLYKSEDRGLNWYENNSLQNSQDKISRASINKMIFSPYDSRVIYVSTTKGLYFSDNSGVNWQLISPELNVNDFCLNPKTKGIIYILSGNQVTKSTDNGQNWNFIYRETRPNISLTSVNISPFDTSMVYLLSSDGNLLLSTDWGDRWKSIYNFDATVNRMLIDYSNSQNIYVLTNNNIFRSLDQAVSWEQILGDNIKDFPQANQVKSLKIDKAGNLFYCSGYGILISSDNGSTWRPLGLISPAGSVNILEFGFNPNNNNEIYYIVEDILYHTQDNGRNWKTKLLPTKNTRHLLIDYFNPSNLYIGLSN